MSGCKAVRVSHNHPFHFLFDSDSDCTRMEVISHRILYTRRFGLCEDSLAPTVFHSLTKALNTNVVLQTRTLCHVKISDQCFDEPATLLGSVWDPLRTLHHLLAKCGNRHASRSWTQTACGSYLVTSFKPSIGYIERP